mmetsp:Transcript_26329/g.52864  ORF Transcript_26329/g.52864 Transcript_26329/m.52864 type:complete len:291 (+) Transcript_26329:285-1157(+)
MVRKLVAVACETHVAHSLRPRPHRRCRWSSFHVGYRPEAVDLACMHHVPSLLGNVWHLSDRSRSPSRTMHARTFVPCALQTAAAAAHHSSAGHSSARPVIRSTTAAIPALLRSRLVTAALSARHCLLLPRTLPSMMTQWILWHRQSVSSLIERTASAQTSVQRAALATQLTRSASWRLRRAQARRGSACAQRWTSRCAHCPRRHVCHPQSCTSCLNGTRVTCMVSPGGRARTWRAPPLSASSTSSTTPAALTSSSTAAAGGGRARPSATAAHRPFRSSPSLISPRALSFV